VTRIVQVGNATLICGDSLEVLPTLPPDSVDSIVCDPPYLLEFMGKDFDRQHKECSGANDGQKMEAWHRGWAKEALRVLKPGGHLLAFGGSRTYHRLASAIEDVGFEIRDQIMWVYGSGMPKNLDVSKALDKAGGISPRDQSALLKMRREAAGLMREQVAARIGCTVSSVRDWEEGRARTAGGPVEFIVPSHEYRLKLADLIGYTADERRLIGLAADRRGDGTVYGIGHMGEMRSGGNTDAAKQWEGWGSSLKPAHEPIVMARKPLIGTIIQNVLAYGTGALNIGGCRVEPTGESRERVGEASQDRRYTEKGGTNFAAKPGVRGGNPAGRWPANLILSYTEDEYELRVGITNNQRKELLKWMYENA
jgi:site-specific DNA-methyltransferase (adenine-specific)